MAEPQQSESDAGAASIVSSTTQWAAKRVWFNRVPPTILLFEFYPRQIGAGGVVNAPHCPIAAVENLVPATALRSARRAARCRPSSRREAALSACPR